jgi:PAS domain S-box-containing protein
MPDSDTFAASSTPPVLTTFRRQAWVYYLIFASAATLGYAMVPKEPAKLIFWPIIGWSSVAAILIGVRLHKPTHAAAWRFLAAGTALFIIGDNFYTFRAQIQQKSDAMFPSYVDVIYLAMYPTMIVGLAWMLKSRTKRERAALLDAAIVTSSLGLLVWIMLIAPYLQGEMRLIERLFSVAYPLADIALLAIGIRLAVGGGSRSKAFWLLACSILPLIAADSLYGYLNLTGGWTEHNPVDVGWALFYMGWGAAALHPSMVDMTKRTTAPPSPGGARLVAVATAALMPPAILIFEQQVTHNVKDALSVGVVGLVLYALVFVRIADLARASAESEGESRFGSLIQNSSDAIVVVNQAGEVIYETPSTERVLGTSLMPPFGRVLSDDLHPADRQRLRMMLAQPDSSGAAEWRMRSGDDWRYIDVLAADLRTVPSVAGVALTIRDSTERKKLSAEREAAMTRANDANRQKSLFLANMSHEIRTPLNGLMGMLGLVLDTNLDTEQRDYLSTMSESAESLAALVNDVLDFSRIEAGRLELDRQPFALAPAIDAGISGCLSQARAKDLDVRLKIDEDVPAVIVGDRLRLRQVLGNLTSNAAKFTDHGTITVSVVRVGTLLRFDVTDTGPGIAPESCERVFEQYIQADASTTRRHGGSGLGLAICKQLVELMGGQIGLESELGRGSNFWFTIAFDNADEGHDEVVVGPSDEPANEPAHTVAPEPPCAPRPQADDATLGHVLVVEDNAVNRKVAVALLKQIGYTCDVAVDGLEAVEIFPLQRYDAILMDCQMPRMDGYEATCEIRQLDGGHRIPIIAMTASAMSSDRDRCLQVGMDDYITKPVNRQALEEALESLIFTTAPSPAVNSAS